MILVTYDYYIILLPTHLIQSNTGFWQKALYLMSAISWSI